MRTALAELSAAVSRARQDYLELLRSSPRALHREGGPRHLTASAVVIDAPAEHVALMWHRKGQFWVQPGGHLEEGGASFEQAARREVTEEIGREEDRKSTRLNSSHVAISYAVICSLTRSTHRCNRS